MATPPTTARRLSLAFRLEKIAREQAEMAEALTELERRMDADEARLEAVCAELKRHRPRPLPEA
jgi:ubiquinone biosynthesis protein UbiJ